MIAYWRYCGAVILIAVVFALGGAPQPAHAQDAGICIDGPAGAPAGDGCWMEPDGLAPSDAGAESPAPAANAAAAVENTAAAAESLLSIKSGNGQAAAVGAAFAQPLRVWLTDAAGDPIGAGRVVTFTPPLSGPGLSVTAPFTAATGADGVAAAAVIANGLWGSYAVTVTAQEVITPAVFSLTNGCPAGVAYVNGGAAGAGRGDSWADAYTDLQEALRLAAACGSFSELWVARGVYTPGVLPRSVFTVPSGVAVYGGFSGVETERTQRDWATNVTVLSGDIDDDDIKDERGVIAAAADLRGVNAWHVVWVDGVTVAVTQTTQLDGFIITGGKANGAYPHNGGGGLYCNGQNRDRSCSLMISNVLFSGNTAASHGGAMFNNGRLSGNSSPVLQNVTFRGNTAGSNGGAMFNYGLVGNSSPTLENVVFLDNAANGNGGAIYNYGLAGTSNPALNGVSLSGNTANYGGAIYNYGYNGRSRPLLTNVVLNDNAAMRGGAIYNNGGANGASSPTLVNVTLVNNTASENGGAIYTNAAGSTTQVTITNSILWGNQGVRGAQVYNLNGALAINYSLVQGGNGGLGGNSGADAFHTGAGNIDADPLLADAGAGNFYLLPGSPAIDAGFDNDAPATDLRGLPRPRVLHADLGAYEAQGFTLAITGGNNQLADVGSSLAQPLLVEIDSAGNEPTGPGGMVIFTPPASGPGLTATAPISAATDGNGAAGLAVSANLQAGTYTVDVTARGVLTSAAFTLTNQYTITIAAAVSPSSGGAASGSRRAAYGEQVTVTATANPGYVFAHWTEGGAIVSGAAVYNFAATASRSLVAHFSPLGPQPRLVALLAQPAAGGVVSGGGWVNSGDVVTVTAAAHAGYVFAQWTADGVAVSADAAFAFTALADRTLVAHFTAVGSQLRTVTVSAEPAAGGTVSGGATVNHGDFVTVIATASPFYVFSHWSEGGAAVSTEAVYSFAATADRTLAAHFAAVGLNPRQITVSAEPAAGGTVSGGGWVGYGETVAVAAAANPGYNFVGWAESGAVVSTDALYQFAATADRVLVALFTANGPQPHTVTVSAAPPQGGTVSGGGVLNFGAVITVAATAHPGYTFVHWTEGGNVVSAAAAYRFTVTADRMLVAHFAAVGAQERTITVSAAPQEGGGVSGGGVVNAGDVITVTATARPGYRFTQWTESGVAVATNAVYRFTVTANRVLVAHFLAVGPNPRQISVSAEPAAGGVASGGGLINDGDFVTVTATANPGYNFVYWSEGSAVAATTAVYRFVATADRTLVAQFAVESAQLPPLAVNDAAGTAFDTSLSVAVTANDRDPAGRGLRVEAVGAAAHGAAVIAADGGSVVYTPGPGYNGLDSFTYRVVDVYGRRDTAAVFVFVAAAGEVIQVQTVTDPGVNSTAAFAAGSARLDVQLPGGFFAGALGEKDVLFLVFRSQTTPDAGSIQPPAGLAFAQLAFDLATFHNEQSLADQPPAQPLPVTIHYDVAQLGGLAADTLNVWYWNGVEWSTEGVTIVSRDLAGNTITVILSHLSRFALFAAPAGLEPGALRVYLPAIVQQ